MSRALNADLLTDLWSRDWPASSIARAIGATPSGVLQFAERKGLSARELAVVKMVSRGIAAALEGGTTLSELVEDDSAVQAAVEDERIRRGLAPVTKVAAPSRPVAPVMDAYPTGWNADRDCLVLATGGIYEQIAKLAARLDMPTTRVLARYHRISRG